MYKKNPDYAISEAKLPVFRILMRKTPAHTQLILQGQHFFIAWFTVLHRGVSKLEMEATPPFSCSYKQQPHELAPVPCNKTHLHTRLAIKINKCFKSKVCGGS